MAHHLATPASPVAPEIAQLAARALESRRDAARRMVKSGGMHPAEADRRLAPWLAIACLCGVDLPELADQIAELRCRDDAAAADADEGLICTEGMARALVADRICPRPRWARVLGTARDRALDRAEASAASKRMPAHEVEADASAARDLRALAEALEFDAARRCPVPAYQPGARAMEHAA